MPDPMGGADPLCGASLQCIPTGTSPICSGTCEDNASQAAERAACGGTGSTCVTQGEGALADSICTAACRPSAMSVATGACRNGFVCKGWWYTRMGGRPDSTGCFPFCSTNADCGAGAPGTVCNARTGSCGMNGVDATRLPDGSPCNPRMTVMPPGATRPQNVQCRGICFGTRSARPTEGICGSFINTRVATGCPEDPERINPLAPMGTHNLAICIFRSCTTNADCRSPHLCRYPEDMMGTPATDREPTCDYPTTGQPSGIRETALCSDRPLPRHCAVLPVAARWYRRPSVMRPTPRTVFAALVATALAASLPAAAQRSRGRPNRDPPVVDPVAQLRQNEARDRFRRGVEHYQNSDWPHAIEEYRAALALWNNPIILFNLAQAYRSDGQLSLAVEHFNRYLQVAPSLTREQRAEVEEAVREIQDTRAVLSFEVEPAGATVTLNGRSLGTTPIARNVEVMPGEYSIHVELANHASRDERVSVRSHEQRLVNVRLRPVDENARLAVSVSPSDATIAINGESVGRGSVNRQVRPGSFTVTVTREGYTEETQTVTVAPLRSESVSITMRPRTRPIYTRPWFWGVIGGVVAVGAGVGIAVAAVSEPTPVNGNGTPPVVQTALSF